MAQFVVRHLEDDVKARLKRRAANARDTCRKWRSGTYCGTQ